MGNVRIASVPAGAKVFKISDSGERELVGDTSSDLFLTDVQVGEVIYELVLEGFRPKRVEGKVTKNETIALGGMLEFFQPPLNNKKWNNSLGISFFPSENGHISLIPFDLLVFEDFIKDKGGNIDYHEADILIKGDDVAEKYKTALVSEKIASSFFEWITVIERKAGYLSNKQYYALNKEIEHEKIDVKFGKDVFEQRYPLFSTVQSPGYAQLKIESYPESALIYIKNELIGKTGLSLSDIKPEKLEIVFRLKGYRDEKRLIDLQPNIEHHVSVKMRQSIGVDMSKKWKNSLGIPMIPLREGVMMAAWETRNKDFNCLCFY